MIKYIGSKRVLVPRIVEAVQRAWAERCAGGGRARGGGGGGGRVLDLFSGTSRVGHALKRAGFAVVANDHNAYAHALARCYVQADRTDRLMGRVPRMIAELNDLAAGIPDLPPGHDEPTGGFFHDTYCLRSRFFHPSNGRRIDAVRERIAAWAREGRLDEDTKAVLLVSLMEAADRVDSTTGLQMAYLKTWAPRAFKPLALRVPELLPRARAGRCVALGLDAEAAAGSAEARGCDIAYIDPPYNQHSYLSNYHIWETLVRWDRPEVYGAACKRVDCRERKSAFNSRVQARAALARVVERVAAPVLIVSFNDEGYVSREEVEGLLSSRGEVSVVEQDCKRYVGAQIGIYNPQGEKVGTVGRLRNREFLFVVGARAREVRSAVAG